MLRTKAIDHSGVACRYMVAGLFLLLPASYPSSAVFAALSTDVAIEYGAEGHDVNPMVYGGNWHYGWNTVFQRDKAELAALAGHTWRVHWWDNTVDRYRWDTHTIDENSGITGWHKLDFEENSDGRWSVDEPNGLEVEYWNNATDFSHSLAVTKTASASQAYVAIREMSHGLPFYFRFDLKIDGAVTFNAAGNWYIAYGGGDNWTSDFRIRLTDNGEVTAIFLDANGATEITSGPLSTDAWHSIEIKYGDNSGTLWVDHDLVGTSVLDLSGKNLTDVFVGSVDSAAAGAEGKIYIDAVRVSESYVGPDVLPPWNDDLTATPRYIGYLTFDGNMMTVDDLCQLAEEIGVTVFFQIPLSREPAYGGEPPMPDPLPSWDTIRYWADLVEYLNGAADPDYGSKSFDWTHATPADNWANLRAQRGRVAPYGLEYIEIGNEPYYQQWGWSPPGSFAYYGQKWADTAHAIKEADPAIKCGLPGRQGYDLWDATIPAILSQYPGEELIDWLAVHQYAKEPFPIEDQIPWWLGAPSSWRWEGRPDDLAGQPWLHYPQDAHAAKDTYLSGQSNYSSIFVGLTEYNFPIFGFSYWPYYNNLVDAVCKASFIGASIEQDVEMAQVFTLDTQQGHTFGLIGDPDDSVVGREITPSYYVYRLWSDYFGTKLVSAAVDYKEDNPVEFDELAPTFDASNGGNPLWETYRVPRLSVWASKDEAGSTLYIMAINRHETESITTTINISSFTPDSTAAVYTVGGAGHAKYSNNESNPENIIIEPSQINNASPSFSYTFEPLSVTAIVLSGQTQVTFPLRINFQPPDSAIPSGYLKDSAQPFGILGIYEYGWK